ncbi:cadherin-4-like [Lampetra fluviatilis]
MVQNHHGVAAKEWSASESTATEEKGRRRDKFTRKLQADGDELFFTLTGQGADQPPEGLFIIEEFVPELSITAALDREEHSEFKLTCSQAADSGAELEPIIVIIKVVDQNDNSPEFAQATFSKEMSEASPMGTSVWTVSASDKDDPSTPNAQMAYKIISDTSAFSIEEQSGIITVSESGLDREVVFIPMAMASHSLEVVAADLNGAGGGLSATATLVITVTDENDHPPRFTSTQASATVETNKVGTEVLRLSVDDEDEKGTANWRTIYHTESGDPGVHFNIHTDAASNQAIITIAKACGFSTSCH